MTTADLDQLAELEAAGPPAPWGVGIAAGDALASALRNAAPALIALARKGLELDETVRLMRDLVNAATAETPGNCPDFITAAATMQAFLAKYPEKDSTR